MGRAEHVDETTVKFRRFLVFVIKLGIIGEAEVGVVDTGDWNQIMSFLVSILPSVTTTPIKAIPFHRKHYKPFYSRNKPFILLSGLIVFPHIERPEDFWGGGCGSG